MNTISQDSSHQRSRYRFCCGLFVVQSNLTALLEGLGYRELCSDASPWQLPTSGMWEHVWISCLGKCGQIMLDQIVSGCFQHAICTCMCISQCELYLVNPDVVASCQAQCIWWSWRVLDRYSWNGPAHHRDLLWGAASEKCQGPRHSFKSFPIM